MSLIIPANSASASGGYAVDNSCRFNSASSDALTKTLGSGGNRKTFTISLWTKPSSVSQQQMFLSADDNQFGFENNGVIFFYENNGGTEKPYIRWSPQYRDSSAWYHVCLAVDTTQGTASNRMKLYVNGSQVTDTISATYPDQNQDLTWNTNVAHAIGRYSSSGGHYDGYMAEYVLIDGSALAPTSFGEFDEDSGIWKPIDVSGLTFGTNGFYLDFENSGALGNDAAGSNNWTEVNLTAIDQSTDTCTNNFATANSLNVNAGAVGIFTDGNLTIKVANSTGSVFGSSSTIGASSGKWYCEVKIITIDSTMIGVSPSPSEDARNNTSPSGANSSGAVGCLAETGTKYVSDSGTTYGAATSANGIMMIALDLDNLKVYFGSGGQWANGSGAWNQSGLTSGAAISITAVASTAEGAYFFGFGDGGGSAKGKVSWNFGSPAYAISSGNTDGNGYGNFEYAVPSGYYALNTKNLAEYGG